MTPVPCIYKGRGHFVICKGGTRLIHSIIQVFILNFVTALDNAIVLAGIFKVNPSSRYWFLAASSMILLTLTRVILVLGIRPLSAMPGLQLALGAILLVLALRTANVTKKQRGNQSLARLLGLIIVTDLAVSFDNLVSIMAVTTNVVAVGVGVFLSIVPLMLLLPIVTDVFSRMPWVQIIAAGVMAQTAVQVLVTDPLLRHQIWIAKFTTHISLLVALVLTVISLALYTLKSHNHE